MDSSPPVPESTGRALSAEDLALLNEEISALAKAGMPLDQGLYSIAQEMRGRMRKVTEALAADMAAGVSLPEALARRKGQIPEYYARVVEAGIRTGRIHEVLQALAAYGRSLADIRWSILAATMYPMVLFVFSVVLLGFLCQIIMPEFRTIFENFHMNLPTVTRVVMWIADHWLWVFVVPPLTVLVGLLVWRTISQRSEQGRVQWASFVYSLPEVGGLVRSARLAAFVELLSILVRRSVPLPEAFALAGQAAADPLLAHGSKDVVHDLEDGTTLGRSLGMRRLLPPADAFMISAAETRGNLADTLKNISEMHQHKVQRRTRFVATIVPPALVLVIGVLVATFFVFGVSAPMFALLEGLAGGPR